MIKNIILLLGIFLFVRNVNADVTQISCTGSLTNAVGTTAQILPNFSIFVHPDLIGAAKSSVFMVPKLQSEDGQPYSFYVESNSSTTAISFSLRQVCHTDWGCSFVRAETHTNGTSAELIAGGLMDYSDRFASPSKISIKCNLE